MPEVTIVSFHIIFHHAVIMVHGTKINRPCCGSAEGWACLQFVISSSLAILLRSGQSLTRQTSTVSKRVFSFHALGWLHPARNYCYIKINQMAKTHKPNSEWLSVKDLECPFIKTVGSFCLPVPTLNLLHFLFHSANATLHTLKYEMEEKLKLESLDTGHCQAVVITAKPGNAARRCRFKFTTWRCCTKNKEDKVGVNRSGCPGHKQASDDTCPPHFIWHSSSSLRGEVNKKNPIERIANLLHFWHSYMSMTCDSMNCSYILSNVRFRWSGFRKTILAIIIWQSLSGFVCSPGPRPFHLWWMRNGKN